MVEDKQEHREGPTFDDVDPLGDREQELEDTDEVNEEEDGDFIEPENWRNVHENDAFVLLGEEDTTQYAEDWHKFIKMFLDKVSHVYHSTYVLRY